MNTYTPLPAWPVAALAAGWLIPKSKLALPVAVATLVSGYVVGPAAAVWLAKRVDDNLAEFGD